MVELFGLTSAGATAWLLRARLRHLSITGMTSFNHLLLSPLWRASSLAWLCRGWACACLYVCTHVLHYGPMSVLQVPSSCVRAWPTSALLPPTLGQSNRDAWSPPAGRRAAGHPAQPPVGAACNPALSSASHLTGPVVRRQPARTSVRACPGSPQPRRLASSSAAHPGMWSPGER